MRIFCISDLHLMARTPGWRNDSFPDTQTQKLKFILSYLKEPEDVLLVGGDFWDTPKIPFYVYAHYLPILFGQSVFSVYGQHDLRYHTRRENTPLYALSQTDVVQIAEEKPIWLDQNVNLYGASWDSDIPKIKNKDHFNILLIHRMITHGGPLFPGQEGNIEAKDFLKKYPFDLVISGDNHKTFFYRNSSGRILINPGSVCRTAIDQIDHKPLLFGATPDGVVWDVEIPIEPADKVFDLEKAIQKGEIEENTKKQVEDFLKALRQHPELRTSNWQSGLNFERNLRERAKELPGQVKEILLECLREKEDVE